MSLRSSVSTCTHDRSRPACSTAGTGEVRSCSAPVRTAELVAWLRAQGESVSVAYEAGPTGFGLARACEAARIPCLVAAPSKIARAPGERVKTDRRDALRLAKLLRLGELTAVRVPSRPRRPPVTSCAPARTRAPTSCAPVTVSPSCSCAAGLVWEGGRLDAGA